MSAFAVDRSPRGLVVASGPDATSFLQSLVSQDLDPIPVGGSAASLLLSPQGKLEVVFRAVHAGEDEWWLDTYAEYGPHLASTLGRFRIRVKVDLEDRTDSTGLVTVAGVDVDAGEAVHVLPTRWGQVEAVDLLGPRADVARVLDGLPDDVERWSPERFEAFRIEAGIPRLGVDVDSATIPQEAFLERDAVSFTKGCFVGQELVCRIDTRGHVNRYLRGLRLVGERVPPAGATVIVDGRERGTVTSAAVVPGEHRVVGLAMVRREVEPPAAAVLRWDEGDVEAALVAVGE